MKSQRRREVHIDPSGSCWDNLVWCTNTDVHGASPLVNYRLRRFTQTGSCVSVCRASLTIRELLKSSEVWWQLFVEPRSASTASSIIFHSVCPWAADRSPSFQPRNPDSMFQKKKQKNTSCIKMKLLLMRSPERDSFTCWRRQQTCLVSGFMCWGSSGASFSSLFCVFCEWQVTLQGSVFVCFRAQVFPPEGGGGGGSWQQQQ